MPKNNDAMDATQGDGLNPDGTRKEKERLEKDNDIQEFIRALETLRTQHAAISQKENIRVDAINEALRQVLIESGLSQILFPDIQGELESETIDNLRLLLGQETRSGSCLINALQERSKKPLTQKAVDEFIQKNFISMMMMAPQLHNIEEYQGMVISNIPRDNEKAAVAQVSRAMDTNSWFSGRLCLREAALVGQEPETKYFEFYLVKDEKGDTYFLANDCNNKAISVKVEGDNVDYALFACRNIMKDNAGRINFKAADVETMSDPKKSALPQHFVDHDEFLQDILVKLDDETALNEKEKSALLMLSEIFNSPNGVSSNFLRPLNIDEIKDFIRIIKGDHAQVQDGRFVARLLLCDQDKLNKITSLYGGANSIAAEFFQGSRHDLYSADNAVTLHVNDNSDPFQMINHYGPESKQKAEALRQNILNHEKYCHCSSGSGGHYFGMVFGPETVINGEPSRTVYIQDSTEAMTDDIRESYQRAIAKVYDGKFNIVKTVSKETGAEIFPITAGELSIQNQCRYSSIILSAQAMEKLNSTSIAPKPGEIKYNESTFETQFAQWFDESELAKGLKVSKTKITSPPVRIRRIKTSKLRREQNITGGTIVQYAIEDDRVIITGIAEQGSMSDADYLNLFDVEFAPIVNFYKHHGTVQFQKGSQNGVSKDGYVSKQLARINVSSLNSQENCFDEDLNRSVLKSSLEHITQEKSRLGADYLESLSALEFDAFSKITQESFERHYRKNGSLKDLRETDLDGKYWYPGGTVSAAMFAYAKEAGMELVEKGQAGIINEELIEENLIQYSVLTGKGKTVFLGEEIRLDDVEEDLTALLEKEFAKLKDGSRAAPEQMFFPINLGDAHWTIVEINVARVGEKFIIDRTYFNPFGSQIEIAVDDVVKAAATKVFTNNLTLHEPQAEKNATNQGDVTSCGPVSCKYVQEKIQGATLTGGKFADGAQTIRLEQLALIAKHYNPEKAYNIYNVAFNARKNDKGTYPIHISKIDNMVNLDQIISVLERLETLKETTDDQFGFYHSIVREIILGELDKSLDPNVKSAANEQEFFKNLVEAAKNYNTHTDNAFLVSVMENLADSREDAFKMLSQKHKGNSVKPSTPVQRKKPIQTPVVTPKTPATPTSIGMQVAKMELDSEGHITKESFEAYQDAYPNTKGIQFDQLNYSNMTMLAVIRGYAEQEGFRENKKNNPTYNDQWQQWDHKKKNTIHFGEVVHAKDVEKASRIMDNILPDMQNLGKGQSRKVFLPVNTGHHWVMLKMDISRDANAQIQVDRQYINPSAQDPSADKQTVLEAFDKRITASVKTAFNRDISAFSEAIKPIDRQTQSDANSCGPITCLYAKQGMISRPLENKIMPVGAMGLRLNQAALMQGQTPNAKVGDVVAQQLKGLQLVYPGNEEGAFVGSGRGDKYRYDPSRFVVTHLATTASAQEIEDAVIKKIETKMAAVIKEAAAAAGIDNQQAKLIIQQARKDGGVSHAYDKEEDIYLEQKMKPVAITKFSRLVQKGLGEAGILSGREQKLNPTRIVGLRSAFVPEGALEKMESVEKTPTAKLNSQRANGTPENSSMSL